MKMKILNIIMTLCFGTIACFTNASLDSLAPSEFEPTICTPDKHNFEQGEKITYVLYYHWGLLWLSAGEVTFELQEKDGRLHLVSIGETYPSYEWFYKVENTYESYLDPETLLPIRTIREINEGNYYLYEEVHYDRMKGQAISHRKRKKQNELEKFVSDIEPCVQDLLSMMYVTRAAASKDEYSVGEEFPLQLFLDKKQYNLKLTYKGRIPNKRIKKQGDFDLLRFTPSLIDGELFDEGDEMNIYVTNDRNKLPVMIESPLSVGEVKAVIKDYEGLKYPLKAKVN
jgi:hypothetical protein